MNEPNKMNEPNIINMINKNLFNIEDEITIENFNIDKIKLSKKELKIKYYGIKENNYFKINKQYLKIIIDDNNYLFKKIYKYLGDLDPTINLFEIMCRFNAIKCAKYLSNIKYPNININTCLGLVGYNISQTPIDTNINNINKYNFLNYKAIVIPPEKYLYMSEWLIIKYIDNINDFNNLFIMFILTGKIHLLKMFSSISNIFNCIDTKKIFFNITDNRKVYQREKLYLDKLDINSNQINTFDNIFLKKIEDTELIKWFIDKITEIDILSEENCDIILQKFNFQLWKYLYNIQEYDHKFHNLIQLIAENVDTIDFIDFICSKLDINDALYLNIYNIRNCYKCNEYVIKEMKERGFKINMIRPDFSIQKITKLYINKVFLIDKEGWFLDKDNNNNNDDNIKLIKNNISVINILIKPYNNPFIFFYYMYCDKIVIKKLIPLKAKLSMLSQDKHIKYWEGNEESFLLLWKSEIDNYNTKVNDTIKYIYNFTNIQ